MRPHLVAYGLAPNPVGHGEGQVLQAVGFCSDHDYPDWEGVLVLLILHAFVCREQDIEVILGESKQLPVFDAGPALPLNGAA